MNVFIRPDTPYASPVKYVLKLIEKNKNLSFVFVPDAAQAQLTFDHTLASSQNIALNFYKSVSSEQPSLHHHHFFTNRPMIETEEGRPDHIATIFYMVNCLQEHVHDQQCLDGFNRFKYEFSYQKKFGNIEQNLVQQYIDTLAGHWGLKGSTTKSAFFISHDIDTIYGSLTQDGLWAIKKGRLDIALKLMANSVIGQPHWKNIDRILKMHSEYDIKSTFFWLVNKGMGEMGIQNADYRIEKEQKLLDMVRQHKSVNGLHKSVSAMSIDEELDKGKIENPFNRYHFLRFLPRTDWPKIHASRLEFDASLGFAEHYGFRNSYGSAFQPYDLINKQPYNFVEAPLNFMDTTFHKYMKVPRHTIADTIVAFYEKNRENCLFSLLWHNTYFTQYKYNGFLEQYKKLIAYFYESKTVCVTPQQIIEQSRITW